MKEWWEKLPDSTKRALKTLWETFLGTFVMVIAMGLTNGWPGLDAFEALVVAAGSAAIAATAATLVKERCRFALACASSRACHLFSTASTAARFADIS